MWNERYGKLKWKGKTDQAKEPKSLQDSKQVRSERNTERNICKSIKYVVGVVQDIEMLQKRTRCTNRSNNEK